MSCTRSSIIRRFGSLLGAFATVGCSADMSGTYALGSVDGQDMPYSFELFGTVTITSGLLTLSDSTYVVSVAFADSEAAVDSGTFTLGASNTIHFSSTLVSDSTHPSAPPPPPPPPPGAPIARHWVPAVPSPADTPSSRDPSATAREDDAQSGTGDRYDGTWDGDRITIASGGLTWVFRR